MARVGLNNFRYSLLDEDENVISPKKLGYAIDCKVSIEKNSVELYADDSLVESDTSFKKGTVTITVDDDDDTTLAELQGHSIVNGEVIRNGDDAAPYCAFGRILKKIVSGKIKYKVEALLKVKFSDTMPDEATAGESIDFKSVSLEGLVLRNKNNDWSKTKTFDTQTEALEYLESLLTKTV